MNPQAVTAKTSAWKPAANASSKAQLMKTLRAELTAMARQPAILDRYLPTARSAWLLLRLAFLDIGRCDNAEPAVVLARPLPAAAEAPLLAIFLPVLLIGRSLSLLRI
jgi:hypothetical protein